jgi:uncharacterized damage-inducible protein DinB
MTLAETYLAEFEQESLTTRKFLERLPDDKLAWKPHEQSMTAGQLALHIAMSPGGIISMAELDEFPLPDFQRPNPQPESTQQILETFESSCAAVREKLPKFSDAQMQAIWRMTKAGKELLAIPRAMMLRTILLNHTYHHRGQFGVYLRLVGAKVPSSYGPSGDEAPDFAKDAM